jgi:predicted rRNA methylase YqxC with S4 and FtsJ domains
MGRLSPRLRALAIEPEADLIALVKPAYEVSLSQPPTDDRVLTAAVTQAAGGLSGSGWRGVATDRSPVPGSRGAIEYLVHARRATLGR